MLHLPVNASTGSLHFIAHILEFAEWFSPLTQLISKVWFTGALEMQFVTLGMCLTLSHI